MHHRCTTWCMWSTGRLWAHSQPGTNECCTSLYRAGTPRHRTQDASACARACGSRHRTWPSTAPMSPMRARCRAFVRVALTRLVGMRAQLAAALRVCVSTEALLEATTARLRAGSSTAATIEPARSRQGSSDGCKGVFRQSVDTRSRRSAALWCANATANQFRMTWCTWSTASCLHDAVLRAVVLVARARLRQVWAQVSAMAGGERDRARARLLAGAARLGARGPGAEGTSDAMHRARAVVADPGSPQCAGRRHRRSAAARRGASGAASRCRTTWCRWSRRSSSSRCNRAGRCGCCTDASRCSAGKALPPKRGSAWLRERR